MKGAEMLSVNGLTKAFGSGSNKLQVLKGVDMNIEQGEMVALMGPSGSGKSTLLNIIGGLLAGDEGSITLGKRSYGLKGPSSVVDVRRELVGWIFQDFHLVERLTALDNVIFSLELSGVPSVEAEERARVGSYSKWWDGLLVEGLGVVTVLVGRYLHCADET